MSKILVISDLHHRVDQVKKILAEVECDRCIMLGDYFDNYNDFVADAQSTAMWLRDEIIPNDKYTLLIGNHDIAYFYSFNKTTRCSGYSDEKRDAIMSILPYDLVHKRFKFFHLEQNFLFSHAGISNPVWKDIRLVEMEGAKLLDVLPSWIERGVRALNDFRHAPIFGAGWDRGGLQRHGGIIWGDWENFVPVSNVNQIVGHTPHTIPEVMIKFTDGFVKRYNAIEWEWNRKWAESKLISSINYALDTHSNHFLVIDDGIVTIYDVMTMMPMKGSTGYVINANGGSFLPDKHVRWPDYGVFHIDYKGLPNDGTEELTGVEICNMHGSCIPTSSNVIMLIANLIRQGHGVKFIRKRKIRKGIKNDRPSSSI